MSVLKGYLHTTLLWIRCFHKIYFKTVFSNYSKYVYKNLQNVSSIGGFSFRLIHFKKWVFKFLYKFTLDIWKTVTAVYINHEVTRFSYKIFRLKPDKWNRLFENNLLKNLYISRLKRRNSKSIVDLHGMGFFIQSFFEEIAFCLPQSGYPFLR